MKNGRQTKIGIFEIYETWAEKRCSHLGFEIYRATFLGYKGKMATRPIERKGSSTEKKLRKRKYWITIGSWFYFNPNSHMQSLWPDFSHLKFFELYTNDCFWLEYSFHYKILIFHDEWKLEIQILEYLVNSFKKAIDYWPQTLQTCNFLIIGPT